MKSILVIDTPNSCGACSQVWKHRGVSHCSKERFKIVNDRIVHPQCPLTPTSELLEDIGELQACAEDRYDKVAQNIVNKLHKAFDWSDKNEKL